MSTTAVIARIDDFLKPLGFQRQGRTWNRRSGSFVDVIDVQVSKGGHTLTVNVGVLDPGVHASLWGAGPPAFVEEPFCTVRARIGELMGDTDVWWSIGEGEALEKAVEAVETHALSFLERMHAREAMKEFLVPAQVMKRKYPPPAISLAILKNELGDHAGACEALDRLQNQPLGAWRARIAEVSKRLGCS